MHINHKIKIDLREFFKYGKFDYLQIGQTKEWIHNNFPAPDEEYEDIWRYGNLELYFTDDRLVQISTQSIESISGGEKLQLETWIFEQPELLTLHYVLSQLLVERIEFEVKHSMTAYNCQTSVRLLESGIFLSFQPLQPDKVDDVTKWYKEDQKRIDPNEYLLVAFTCLGAGKLNE